MQPECPSAPLLDEKKSWRHGIPLYTFFNTAGNPVSCAAATASIEVIEEEHLLENAVTVGNYMMERFKDMMTRHECIGDVRGSGLMFGVDIVKNRESKERDVQTTAKFVTDAGKKA